AILSLFSLNNIGGGVFQSAAQGFDGALLRAFWDNIRWSVLVFVGTLAVAIYYFAVGNDELSVGVLIGGMAAPFIGSVNLFANFLGGKRDFARMTLYGVLDNVLPIVLFIGVVVVTSDPVILVVTYCVSNFLAGLYFFGRTVGVYHARMGEHDAEMLRY